MLKLCEQIKAHRGDERGTALIETALSLPLICLLLMGAGEFARVAYAAIEVSNAANAAANYAASSHNAAGDWSSSGSGPSKTFSGGIVNVAKGDAANLTGSNAVTVTDIYTSCACADTTVGPPSSCTDVAACSAGNSALLETITVSTQATYSPLLRYFGLGRKGWFSGPTSFKLTAHASQIVSNQ
jgi:Flp pilus assembly protein TadG